jgi:hypothetical protein
VHAAAPDGTAVLGNGRAVVQLRASGDRGDALVASSNVAVAPLSTSSLSTPFRP